MLVGYQANDKLCCLRLGNAELKGCMLSCTGACPLSHLTDVIIDGDLAQRGAQRRCQLGCAAAAALEQLQQDCRAALAGERARFLEGPAAGVAAVL